MHALTSSPLAHRPRLGCSPSLGSVLQGGAQTLCLAAVSGLFCGERKGLSSWWSHSLTQEGWGDHLLLCSLRKYRFVEQLIGSYLCANAVVDTENVKATSLPPASPPHPKARQTKQYTEGVIREQLRPHFSGADEGKVWGKFRRGFL